MTNIVIAGCCGRMGRIVLETALADKDVNIQGLFEHPRHDSVGKDAHSILGLPQSKLKIGGSAAEVAGNGDVIIDFTSPAGTLAYLEAAKKVKAKMVIATTGFKEDDLNRIKTAADTVPMVMAPNMSIGINVLLSVVNTLAHKLGPEYDMEVIEAHHNQKKDAPSGTALALAKAVAAGRGLDFEKSAVYGREGITGERKPEEIGIHAVRGGNMVGEHTVLFAGPAENIEVRHNAYNRSLFAQGALRAAKFLGDKDKGFYDMQDVLGLR